MRAYFNDVNDWLSVGGDLDLAEAVTGQDYRETIDQLRKHGVTHVLDLRSEWDDEDAWAALAPGVEYHHAPIIDSWSHMPDEAWFADIENYVKRFQSNKVPGDRLYVHCLMGINRGPSASMLALLTVDPSMKPFEAFLQIRAARDVAGLVYAEAVGVRHLLNTEGVTAEDLAEWGSLPQSAIEFSETIDAYWTPERQRERRREVWVDFETTSV